MKTDWPVFMDWLCYKASDTSIRYDSLENPELYVVFDEYTAVWKAALDNVHRMGRWNSDIDIEPVLSEVLTWADHL